MSPEIIKYAVGLLVCYLIGAIPFGYILVRIVGKDDIRKRGSGNIGATNAARILGVWAFFVVFALDFLKGLAAVFVVFNLFNNPHIFNDGSQFLKYELTWKNLQVICGLAAIIGHLFPVYLKFRGGKGIATSAGVFIYLATYSVVVALLVWAVIFLLTRYVSLASIVSALAFTGCYYLTSLVIWSGNPFESNMILLTLAATLVSCGVLVTHRKNIVRLFQGCEPKSGEGRNGRAL